MNLSELSIKISVDSQNAEKGIKDAESNTKKLGQTMSKISSGVAKAGKVIGKAVGAASIALGKLALDAVRSYGEYEQQVGGIKKLFGDSWQTVVKDAQQAFKTAGVDANTYMQNVTSFSASLIKSLKGNTEEAAKLSNRAMRDMADNANTFGTSIDSIQAAYKGFAKQNYTMLDNLKLGYGGTATEMKKLIRDAAQMKDVQKELGITVDASSMSFDNIIKAISVMQKHLNIAGTTAAEAGQTFQGSFTMMKASWENLKIAMVDPEGNVNDAIQNLVDSTKTFAENAFPLFSNALKGIATAVKQLAPQIGGALPQMITDLLPDLAAAAVSLITGLVKGIVDNLPLIADAASKILDEISRVFKESDSPVLQLIGEALGAVKDVFDWLVENQQIVVTAITAIIGAFAIAELVSILSNLNPISLAIGAIATAATLIIENWASIEEFFVGLWEGVKTAVDDAWKSVELWWTDIKESISAAWSVIATWFDNTVWKPLKEAFEPVWSAIELLWTGVKDAINTAWATIAGWFDRTVWQPLKKYFDPVWQAISKLWDDISEPIKKVWEDVKEAISPVIDGIKGVIEGVINTVKDVIDWFEKLMGFNGQDLSETTSGHTHTNTTINKVVTYTETVEGANGGTVEVTGYDDGSNTAIHRNANGNQTGVSGGRGFAKGNWFVPYDMPAFLHRNEMVLTASQARRYREGYDGGVDYERIGAMIGASVERAIRNVNVYLGADRVGALTSGYVDHDIKASDMAILRGMGG